MDGLRITDTNSANDSKGRALGFEGDDFLYVLAGFVAALAVFLVLTVILGFGQVAAFLFAVPLLAGPLAWVLLLRHNKPAGFAQDWFEQTFNGEGWSWTPVRIARKEGASDEGRS